VTRARLEPVPSRRDGAPKPVPPNGTAPVLWRLEDLVADPGLLEPPPIVLPRLAWQGRLTLLAAPEKSGKSTLAGQAVAALAEGGEFLGEPVTKGAALWLALDEPLPDAVRRFDRYGVSAGVHLATEVPDPATFRRWLSETHARVVVVDTLSEFARLFVDDFASASQWVGVLHELRAVLSETGAAGVLLHHTVRDGSRYRDSGQIGAGSDVILEMAPVPEDASLRKVRARGRVTLRDFRLRFDDPRYHLDDTELPLDLRVYRVVRANPGASLRRIREAVYGRADLVDAAVADLVKRGAIEDRGNGRGRSYFERLE
jgi:hypothetical protein